jgi:hypothetical protein
MEMGTAQVNVVVCEFGHALSPMMHASLPQSRWEHA